MGWATAEFGAIGWAGWEATDGKPSPGMLAAGKPISLGGW
jgi:hypothetical protein